MAQVLAADAAVDAVYRADWGRIVATLIRLVGDFDVAEEAAQEAFSAAVDQWRSDGVPDHPRLGSTAEAARSYAKALDLVTNDAERRFLERRLREVRGRNDGRGTSSGREATRR